MKNFSLWIVFPFFCCFFLQVAVAQFSYDGREVITTSEYCCFLQAVASHSDLHHFYDPKMRQIVAFNEGDHVNYRVIEGEEEQLMQGLSELDIERCYNWRENGSLNEDKNGAVALESTEIGLYDLAGKEDASTVQTSPLMILGCCFRRGEVNEHVANQHSAESNEGMRARTIELGSENLRRGEVPERRSIDCLKTAIKNLLQSFIDKVKKIYDYIKCNARSNNKNNEFKVNIELRIFKLGRKYKLYLPDLIDPNRKYWLVCYAHGHPESPGHNANLLHLMARGDCIGIAPSFPYKYKVFLGNSDKQIIKIITSLKEKYSLHRGLFLFGHSHGAQFAQRFMLANPHLVLGCAAFSPRSWPTGKKHGVGNVDSVAKIIPLAIACGKNDTAVRHERSNQNSDSSSNNSSGSANSGTAEPLNRINWYNIFEERLRENQFFFKAKTFSEMAHASPEKEIRTLVLESFLLGTRGMLPEEEAEYELQIASIQKNIETCWLPKYFISSKIESLRKKIEQRDLSLFQKDLRAKGWSVNKAAIDSMRFKAESFIKEEISLLNESLAKR